MGRSPCCEKEGLNRGAWTAMEDKILINYIKIHGEGKWRNLPRNAGLKRCGKSCRLRWLNYLRPDIKRGNITSDEEELIVKLHKLLGNRWSLIAGRLPGRTDNEIKNYWNTNLGRRLHHNPQHHQSETMNDPWNSNSNSNSDVRPVDSCVVRTQAFRCTEVAVTQSEPSKTEHLKQNEDELGRSVDYKAFDQQSSSEERYRPSDDCDFAMDFDVDDLSLLDFLNAELSSSETSCVDKRNHVPTSSSQTLDLLDESCHDMDFPSMGSLVETDFDWI